MVLWMRIFYPALAGFMCCVPTAMPTISTPSSLSWRERRPDIVYLFSQDILESGLARSGCHLSKARHTYSDECLHAAAFGSTDIGISFAMCIEKKRSCFMPEISTIGIGTKRCPAKKPVGQRRPFAGAFPACRCLSTF